MNVVNGLHSILVASENAYNLEGCATLTHRSVIVLSIVPSFSINSYRRRLSSIQHSVFSIQHFLFLLSLLSQIASDGVASKVVFSSVTIAPPAAAKPAIIAALSPQYFGCASRIGTLFRSAS